MHANIPKISDSEYEIMKIIWKTHPIKSQEIIDLVDVHKNWSEKTIKTIINRLLKKGAIGYEKESKAYLYYPLIKEVDYRKIENQSFLKKVYNGSFNAMIVNFVKDMKLSSQEIDELKKLLDEESK
ncbi:BlaI/MecI/CopY family transcriptional regulator [Vallitalea guaymasensis]|mgnify:CR=1 FL=1|uniref:BlaI/MecI/CopY family transcriptional regulator n=1 Tax=Vallitalea guaymasensis TaxID=1185412 RepID=UPI002357D8A4|nr:BlaI/MecI/CopY family transcriptional regulator [Vallitalea guaymasensis]